MALPSGKRFQKTIEAMAIEKVDLPSHNMVNLSIVMWKFTRG